MSTFLKLAETADRFGLRRWVARAASLAYADQRFEVDAAGHWVNRQAGAAFVSPTIHTANYAHIEQSVLDNWTWEYRPTRGDTVIDVGAGIGEETVVFSRLVGAAGKVIAIEAHPETFKCLTATIEQSALANVTAHEVSEARTDPASPGAWYDQQGAENGDKCAWTFGAPYVTFPDGSKWKLQGEWSNAAYNAQTGYPNSSGQKGCLSGL